jgi:hypothetical protein
MDSYFNFGDLIINIKDDKKTINYCEEIPVIPQYLATCWFNSILSAMIYSDGLSQIIYEKAVEDDWQDDNNGAFKTLMLLFMNYVRAIKNGKLDYIDKLREFLKKYKTELILLDFLTYYHKDLFEIYNYMILNGYVILYILYILQNIGLNCSLILLSNGKFYNDVKFDFIHKIYIDYDNSSVNKTPEILLFNIKNISNFQKYKYPEITETDLKNFGEEIIEFYGVPYKLDCILLADKDKKHTITGLTCNGSKYVYNGWWLSDRENPCNLMPYDWTINNSNFCLDVDNCELSKEKEEDFCYNFKNNERIMVYVKIGKEKQIEKKQVKKINRISASIYLGEKDKDDMIGLLSNRFERTLDRNNDIQDLIELYMSLSDNKSQNITIDNISNILGVKKINIDLLKKKLRQKYFEILQQKDLNELKKLFKEKHLVKSVASQSISSIS